MRNVLRCEELEDREVPAVVSPSLSFVSLASPVNASGTTDLVTITVKDTDGDAISGLANGDFALSLSGGSSTGTFGPVFEIGTSGTYTAPFTGSLAGTPTALTVAVDGTELSSHPTVRVTPGAVSASNWTADFAYSYDPIARAANVRALTLVVKDAAGNVVTGLPSSAFQLDLSDAMIAHTSTGGIPTTSLDFQPAPPGTAIAGTFGPMVEGVTVTSRRIFGGAVTTQGGPGTYTATFSPGLFSVGEVVQNTLTITVDGAPLANPLTLRVYGNGENNFNGGSGGNGGNVIVQVAPAVSIASPTVAPGATALVTIVAGKTDGSVISGLTNTDFTLLLSGGTSTGAFGPVTETAVPGTYTALFTGQAAGTPTALTVFVDGVQATNQPTVQVTRPGAPPEPPPEPPPVVAAPAPLYSGVFMFGNLMVLAGSGLPSGFAVIPLPPGCFGLFADANGDGRGDVVLLVPHTIFVLDGLTGAATVIPF